MATLFGYFDAGRGLQIFRPNVTGKFPNTAYSSVLGKKNLLKTIDH